MFKMQPIRQAAFPLAATIFFLSFASSAFAHATTLWCYVENNRVYVEGFFMGGRKVQNGHVVVVNNKGEKILEGKTDKEGKFSIRIPPVDNVTLTVRDLKTRAVVFRSEPFNVKEGEIIDKNIKTRYERGS